MYDYERRNASEWDQNREQGNGTAPPSANEWQVVGGGRNRPGQQTRTSSQQNAPPQQQQAQAQSQRPGQSNELQSPHYQQGQRGRGQRGRGQRGASSQRPNGAPNGAPSGSYVNPSNNLFSQLPQGEPNTSSGISPYSSFGRLTPPCAPPSSRNLQTPPSQAQLHRSTSHGFLGLGQRGSLTQRPRGGFRTPSNDPPPTSRPLQKGPMTPSNGLPGPSFGLPTLTSAQTPPHPPRTPPTAVQYQQGFSPQRWREGVGHGHGNRPRRLPPSFIITTDSNAAESWRNHERPIDTVRIPSELVLQDRFYQNIARDNGTFIFTEDPGASGNSIEFGIWGEERAVAATKRAILTAIEEWNTPKKSHRASRFAKLVSLSDKGRERAERKWRQEVMRQRFRQRPPQDMSHGAIGLFHWPTQSFRPEAILGNSFEALDPIRMSCQCYIIFDNERSGFQVLGGLQGVQAALLRIRKTCFQIAARQVPTIRMYVLQASENSLRATHVVLEPYQRPALVHDTTDGRPAVMSSPRADGRANRRGEVQVLNSAIEERLRNVITRTMPKLHYYRGQVNLRFRLGRFLATLFKKPQGDAYTFDEYEDMIGQSQFTGEVTQELGNGDLEANALQALQKADELLVPWGVMAEKLSDVRPTYTAVFIFADAAGDLRLAMSWVEAKDESSQAIAYEIISRKWTRMERDTGTTAPIVDVSLKDLTTGLAWQFDIDAAQAVDESRLLDKLTTFVDSIRIDANEASKATFNKLFVMHKPFGGHLKSIQQRMTYSYNIKGTDYTVELARFQDRKYPPPPSTTLLSYPPATVYEPRWGLNVYRGDWDKMLTTNERLPIGERAEWEDDLDTWFPEDMTKDSDLEHKGAGFGQLMGKLKQLQRIVTGTKADDVSDGATVA